MNESRPPGHIGRVAPGARRAPVLPAWLMSAVIHALIFILAAWMFKITPRRGVSAERAADVGIALTHQDGTHEYYDTDSTQGDQSRASSSTAKSLESLLDDQPPPDTAAALPARLGIIGPSAVQTGGPADPGPRSAGSAKSNDAIGGKATVEVFGVEGSGYKFVYVFDRSASMGGAGRNALAVAKNELLASLESLQETHQFQIIFYNEQPLEFNPSGQRGRLAFATERNKQRARRFVGTVIDAGGTEHETALMLAIKYRPDVIFFLTDAAVPRLGAEQLRRVQSRASGITINAIEFGRGPKQGGENFLARLAWQNGGQYCYRDITKLVPAQRK